MLIIDSDDNKDEMVSKDVNEKKKKPTVLQIHQRIYIYIY
jgi:hypothetical protein